MAPGPRRASIWRRACRLRHLVSDADDPVPASRSGTVPNRRRSDGWVTVTSAAALNHHDVWTLRGVGLPEDKLPMILGGDAAGVDSGRQRGRRALGDRATASAATRRSTRSARCSRSCTRARSPSRWPSRAQPRAQAGRAELRGGRVPADGVADRLPDAVHRGRAAARPDRARPGRGRRRRDGGDRARRGRGPAGLGHQPRRGEARRALELGADEAVETGERLPERVDAVIETVGEATWDHSLRSLKPGGTLVVAGSTSGPNPPADLRRVFFLQLNIVGSTMGTRDELRAARPFLRGGACARRSTVSCRWARPGRASRRWRPASWSGRSSSRS